MMEPSAMLSDTFENKVLRSVTAYSDRKMTKQDFLLDMATCVLLPASLQPNAGILREAIQRMISSRNCASVNYSFAKVLVELFRLHSNDILWKNLFRDQRFPQSSALFIDVLSLFLSLKAPPEVCESVTNIFTKLPMGAVLKPSENEKEQCRVSQRLYILEQCFERESLTSNPSFFDNIVANWDAVCGAIESAWNSRKCSEQRRALSFLSVLSGFLLQIICQKKVLANSQAFLSLAGKTVKMCDGIEWTTVCHQDHWLGSGHLEGSGEHHPGTKFSKLITLVMLQSSAVGIFLEDCPKHDTCTTLVRVIASLYSCADDLVSGFLGNDENLMDLIVSSCLIWPKIKDSDGSGILSPHKIWLLALDKINWDESVVLDWLMSEPSGLLMLLYYLKFSLNYWTELVDEAGALKFPENRQCLKEESQCSSADSLEVQVLEELGGVIRHRTVRLFPNEGIRQEPEGISTSTVTTVSSRESSSPDSTLKKSVELLGRLRAKLEKLHNSHVLGFNPNSIVRLIVQIEKREMK